MWISEYSVWGFLCYKFFFQELYGDCDKLRQTVFQLATETEDNDSSLGEKSWNLALLMLITHSHCLFILVWNGLVMIKGCHVHT